MINILPWHKKGGAQEVRHFALGSNASMNKCEKRSGLGRSPWDHVSYEAVSLLVSTGCVTCFWYMSDISIVRV